ncbi:hypothetical protein H6F96_13760 [Microcoleus sp. FACHB-53]|nr:hypothetical protein [Microcoleus sp. FACHB-53]MBD2125133.1 hypothetical protein [Microcoleus sp. FACHB-1]
MHLPFLYYWRYRKYPEKVGEIRQLICPNNTQSVETAIEDVLHCVP